MLKGAAMAQILVRGLEDNLITQLKKRAEDAGRSMEAEVRTILRDTIGESAQSERTRQFAETMAGFRHQTARDLAGKEVRQDDSAAIVRKMRDGRTAHQASLLRK
jgi:plasmid stability protein